MSAFAVQEGATWVLALCARIAAITDRPGTTTRTFLSPRTRAVHTLLAQEMQALGMTVRTDSIGNLRGLYPGRGNDAPVLLLGSHIDTVIDAGAYDGVLGVALPLALLHLLGGERLPFAIEVMAFSEEEGVRFRKPFLGSLAYVGALTPELLALEDDAGITVEAAVRAFGLDPALDDAGQLPGTFAFLETHIEQGPVLEALGQPLAVVHAIAGQTRLELTFNGLANHAGTTPMQQRSDALVAAARFVVAVSETAGQTQGLVATVGRFNVGPGAVNIVPGRVVCSLDVRHADDAVRVHCVAELERQAHLLAARDGVSVSIVETSRQSAVPLDVKLCAQLAQAAHAATGAQPHAMISGAGHDAMIVARVLPAAMLFLRTPRGLSHHPDEAVGHEDVQRALETYLHLVRTLEPATLMA